MEVKITVELRATLQIANPKTGEWDYIKPMVGVEATFKNEDLGTSPVRDTTSVWFDELWEDVLSLQFKKIIDSLLEEKDEPEEEAIDPADDYKKTVKVPDTEPSALTPVSDEYEY